MKHTFPFLPWRLIAHIVTRCYARPRPHRLAGTSLAVAACSLMLFVGPRWCCAQYVSNDRIENSVDQVTDAKAELQAVESHYMESLDELFLSLDRAIASISTESLEGDLTSLLLLSRIVDQLIAKAGDVERAHQGYAGTAREYERVLSNLAPILFAAEAEYRGYASQEVYSDLQEQYEAWVEILVIEQDRTALRIETVRQSIDLVQENGAYVEATIVFLHRLSKLLHRLDGLATGVSLEQMIQSISRYVRDFEQLKKSVGSLRLKLREVNEAKQQDNTLDHLSNLARTGDVAAFARNVHRSSVLYNAGVPLLFVAACLLPVMVARQSTRKTSALWSECQLRLQARAQRIASRSSRRYLEETPPTEWQ